MDFVIRRARVRGLPDLVDIGVNGGRIETVHPHVHMLVDDTDDPNSRSLEYLAGKTMREGFHGRVTASHCGAMAAYNDVYAAKVIDMVIKDGHEVARATLLRELRRPG